MSKKSSFTGPYGKQYGTFIIFVGHGQGNLVEKSNSYSDVKFWDCL